MRLVNAVKRQAAFRGFGVPPLQSIAVEPTNCCNLRCVMCYGKDRAKGYIDWELYAKIVDEASALKVGLGLNFGGESALHPRFNDMISYASHRGLLVGFNTNGTLLTPEVIGAFISKGSVCFSVDGLAESYGKIRGGHFDTVLSNIDGLVSKRHNGNPVVAINLVKQGQSHNEIKEFIEYFIDKVDYIQITDCLDEHLKIINKDILITENLVRRRTCLSPFRYMAVYWDGSLGLCCHDLAGRTRLKVNVRDSCISKVWRSKEYQEIRKAHRRLEFPKDSVCAGCESWVYPYIDQPPRVLRGVTVWRHGASTYFTKKPDVLGLTV